MLPSISKIAELLGGDVSGGQVLCPGPGHTAADRSLSIKLDSAAPDGFVLHSFAGDDVIACRDYVRGRVGLPPFEKKKKEPNGGGAQPYSPTVAKYVYRLADGKPYLQVQRTAAKEFPQYHWDGEKWISGKPKGPKIPYRLPELIAAAPETPVYFVEGEKPVDSLAKIGFVATTASEGAYAKWAPELTPYFKDRHVVILPDADKIGRQHAEKVARAIDNIAASVRVLDLYPEQHDGSDVADWLVDDTAGAKLAKLAKKAPLWEASKAADEKPRADDDAELEKLARMSLRDYERARKEAAKRLGMRPTMLDKIVQATRGDDDEPAPSLYEHWNVEAASAPVDGGALLRDIKQAIRRYVFLSDEQATAVALWIMLSWLHDREMVVTHSPILFVTSAERDSGKTTLLGVINFLARRSLQSVDISGAALFRSIAKWQPTFIVDEADDALAENIDLRSVINSGWTRGQGVIRCHPDTHEPELFSTFAPKVVAMKGRNLPDTTLSRAIVITMKPARAANEDEQIADFNYCDTEALALLRSQLVRWTADNAEALAKITPEIPAGFHNRRRANWVPLMRIAEACGDDAKAEARKAALAIEAVAETFDRSVGVELLQAIAAVFDYRAKDENRTKDKDRISSKDLVHVLAGDETSRWATYNKGKWITQRQVADLLKPHGIGPKTIRLDDNNTTPRGYLLEMFTEAFERFCPAPPFSSATSATDLFSQDFSQNSSATERLSVADEKREKCPENGPCCAVADEKGGTGAESPVGTRFEPPQERTAWGVKFTLLGQAQPGAACLYCQDATPDDVGPVMVVKSAGPLHEACAPAWITNQDKGA